MGNRDIWHFDCIIRFYGVSKYGCFGDSRDIKGDAQDISGVTSWGLKRTISRNSIIICSGSLCSRPMVPASIARPTILSTS